jgi:hypothetical protein
MKRVVYGTWVIEEKEQICCYSTVFLFYWRRTENIAVLQLYNKRILRVKYNMTTRDQGFLRVQFIACLCDTKVFRKW